MKSELEKYAQMGYAAMIPGMQHMVDLMQAEVDRMRAAVADGQEKRGPGRPKGSGGGNMGWSSDPEERKQQMAARMAKRKSKKMSTAQQRYWDSLSPKDRAARIKKLNKARLAKKKKQIPITRLTRDEGAAA